MSPALSHVEQSRNTLSFAKEVTNSAQVNMVLTGFINVLTLALEEDSAVARMIKLVEDAHNQCSPMEQFIEHFARIGCGHGCDRGVEAPCWFLLYFVLSFLWKGKTVKMVFYGRV